MRSYFKNHWTGQLGFGLTLFVNLIGLSFIAGSLAIEDWSLWASALGTVAILALLVWQVIGGWRCASAIQIEQGAGNNAWAIYLGIVFAVSFMGLQILDVAAKRYYVEPMAETIIGNDDFTLQLRGDTIELGGEINYLMYQKLLITLSKNKDVRNISLDSNGGIVFAARSIGRIIEENNLTTRVDSLCYSACTLVFAAGSKRLLSEGAEMGFHGYRFDIPQRYQSVDPVKEQKKDQDYLISRGVDSEFLERAFSTDAWNLWIPKRTELYEAGFITEP